MPLEAHAEALPGLTQTSEKITKQKNGSVNLSDGRGRHHANIPTEPSLQLVIASNGHSSQI